MLQPGIFVGKDGPVVLRFNGDLFFSTSFTFGIDFASLAEPILISLDSFFCSKGCNRSNLLLFDLFRRLGRIELRLDKAPNDDY